MNVCRNSQSLLKCFQNILEFNADYTRNMEAFIVHDYNQTTSMYSDGGTIINLYNSVSGLM